MAPYYRTAPRIWAHKAGEILTLANCLHFGYAADFIIIRGVPQHSTFDREYCNQWQPTSESVSTFVQHITQEEDNACD